MRRSLTSVWTAALCAGLLGGCAAQGDLAAAPPISRPPHDRLETILNAPSAFSCRGEGANEDISELQCESETRNND